MNIKKMYLKRKILRGIVGITENTPDWVRYYFGPILYPFFAVYTNRGESKFLNAVKAVRNKTATQEQMIRIISKNCMLQYYKIRDHRDLLKDAIIDLFNNHLDARTAFVISTTLSRFMYQEKYYGPADIEIFTSLRRKCLQVIIESIQTKEGIQKFLDQFGHDAELPETAKQQLLVKFLKAMSPKNIFQEMIELEKDTSLSFDMYRDEECKELYETRLKRFAKLEFTKEQAEQAFDVFRATIDTQDSIESFYEGDDMNEDNYKTFIFDEDERKKFELHRLTGSYFLRKNLIALVSVWSHEEFNEILTPKDYFAKRKELRDTVS